MHSLVHPPTSSLERSQQQEAEDEEGLELHISLSKELYLRADRREGLADAVRKVVEGFRRCAVSFTFCRHERSLIGCDVWLIGSRSRYRILLRSQTTTRRERFLQQTSGAAFPKFNLSPLQCGRTCS
jgi:hypothetical protein